MERWLLESVSSVGTMTVDRHPSDNNIIRTQDNGNRSLSYCRITAQHSTSNMCALHCAQLLHTILHRTDLIIFPLTLQTITIAPMMSIWGKGGTALYIQTFRSPSQHITQRLHDNSTNVSLLPPNGSILSLLNFSYMMNMPPKIRHIKHTHKIARAGLKLCGTLGPNHFVGPHYTYCIQYSEFWHVLPCSASTARDKKSKFNYT